MYTIVTSNKLSRVHRNLFLQGNRLYSIYRTHTTHDTLIFFKIVDSLVLNFYKGYLFSYEYFYFDVALRCRESETFAVFAFFVS